MTEPAYTAAPPAPRWLSGADNRAASLAALQYIAELRLRPPYHGEPRNRAERRARRRDA